MRLQGRVALVTGGGTGIGRATSEALAAEGARVAINYSQSEEGANEVARHIRAEGGAAFTVQANVADETQVKAMAALIEKEYGRLDILVNNAGWSTRVPHDQMNALTDEIWDKTLDTNLRGAFYCVRACVPLLRKQTGASIVNVASVAGITGMGSSIVYAASKGALITMTKSLARALAPAIRVNAVAPGFVRTRFANWPASAFDQGEELTPLGRLATVDDIAAVVVFFAAEAQGTTGEVIVADGGTTVLGPHLRQ